MANLLLKFVLNITQGGRRVGVVFMINFHIDSDIRSKAERVFPVCCITSFVGQRVMLCNTNLTDDFWKRAFFYFK